MGHNDPTRMIYKQQLLIRITINENTYVIDQRLSICFVVNVFTMVKKNYVSITTSVFKIISVFTR